MLTTEQKGDIRAMLAGVEPALAARHNPDIIDAASAVDAWAWNRHNEHVSLVACRAFRLRRAALTPQEVPSPA